jgi:hypothetical protein
MRRDIFQAIAEAFRKATLTRHKLWFDSSEQMAQMAIGY